MPGTPRIYGPFEDVVRRGDRMQDENGGQRRPVRRGSGRLRFLGLDAPAMQAVLGLAIGLGCGFVATLLLH